MPNTSANKTKQIHERNLLQKVILFPFFLFFRLWYATLRITTEVVGADESTLDSDEAQIILTWHNNLFVLPTYLQKTRKGRMLHALISASNDGAWLTALFSLLRIKAIRGSGNYRGAQSLKDMIRVVKDGNDIGITPDGSKGPAYVLKVGAAALAKISRKNSLVLYGFSYSSAWRPDSWDRFFIPKPFSKVHVKIEKIDNYAALGASDPHEASWILQQKLMQLQPEDPLLPDPYARREELDGAEQH